MQNQLDNKTKTRLLLGLENSVLRTPITVGDHISKCSTTSAWWGTITSNKYGPGVSNIFWIASLTPLFFVALAAGMSKPSANLEKS